MVRELGGIVLAKMDQRSDARVALVALLLVGELVACGQKRALEPARRVESGAVIDEFPVPSQGASPWGITVGRDGALWFTEARPGRIGRLDPRQPLAVRDFPLPNPDSEPHSITAAPDGALWFFESRSKRVARMDPASPRAVEEFPIPSAMTDVFGLAADDVGGVWFTQTGGRRIGRFGSRPPHALTELPVRGYPLGIAVGPDRDVWFAMLSWNSVGHIRPRSPEELEFFEIAVPDCNTSKIAAGPKGDVWFLDPKCRTFGRLGVRPPHAVKEFEYPRSLGTMVDLAVARDGSVWLLSKDSVFRCETEPPYSLRRFPIPTPGADPQGMVVGPDGNLWFTESRGDQIGRVNLSRARKQFRAASPTIEMVAEAQPEYIPKRPAPVLATLNLHSDRECVVTVDGVEKGRLRRNDGDVFLVPPGRHLVTAVETDSGRSWTRLIDVSEVHGAVAEILFTPQIEEEALGFEPTNPGIAFARIPPGEFWMGDDKIEFGQAGPRHRVRITRPFEIGRSLVTQEQWKRLMNRNPTPWELEGDDRPVVNVSWDETQEFLRRLDGLEPYALHRLPTEAEWEYACRAGNESDALERDQNVRSSFGIRQMPPRRANAWGLYDLGGTTSEWCQDWHGLEYYRISPLEDPPGPRSGTKKVVKGGNFGSDAAGLRPAQRASYLPINRSLSVGFRVVRVPR
jgi:streptogramin lyase